MMETKELVQLRQLNLELLRQLWVGQDAVRRSVARAASESSLDSSSSSDPQMPSSQRTSSVVLRASCPRDAHQGDPGDMSSPGRASSGVSSLPPAKFQYQESLTPLRPCSAPLLATSDSSDPEYSAELEAQARMSILDQQSKLSKPRVTFNKESPVPEESWRLRPYLGYDWIAVLCPPQGLWTTAHPSAASPRPSSRSCRRSGKPTRRSAFTLTPSEQAGDGGQAAQAPRRPPAHPTHPHRPQFLGPRESSGVEKEHECVYCYRVNRRLFLVPSDPSTPCRLCRVPRDQRGPETLAAPAQVRVSIPLSMLDPPHQYRIHRRKSFDASDTLALPRHCLLGWDILPPKSEKSSAPKSLDLWSCVASEAQHRQLSATSPSHLALPTRVPIWSEPQVSRPCASRLKP